MMNTIKLFLRQIGLALAIVCLAVTVAPTDTWAQQISKGQAASIAKDARVRKLMDWMRDKQNPWFARSIVNRLWKQMTGRGLVEPVDDFRATNPPTHPALLDKLAEDFSANGYSVRHTLRLICNSSTYARSADASPLNQDDDRFYSHGRRRPLEPEVLADAISDVLGVGVKYGNAPIGMRAVELVDPTTPSRTLDILGRCDRSMSCETTSTAGGLAGATVPGRSRRRAN